MSEEKQLKFYQDTAPEPGDEKCLCSWCGEKISADGDEIRLWKERDENQMAIVHSECFATLHNIKFTSVKYGS